MTVTIVCVPVGATIAGLLGIQALPAFGWRWLFAIGGVVPMVAAVLFMRLLPESPRYLARHPERWQELVRILRRMGHTVDASHGFVDPGERSVVKASIAALFHPEYRRDTLALWGAFFSCLLAVYSGFSWLTSLLTAAGFGSGTANTGITAFNLGGVAGALAGGVAITRFGSRAAMLTMTACAIASTLALSTMSMGPGAALPIIATLAVTGALINGVQTTMFALAAYVYPGAVRATGVGSAVAFGRSGAVLSGYAGSWAIAYHGSASFFGLIAAAMCATFVALALVRRHIPASAR